MPRVEPAILWIDRWSKYIGLAYAHESNDIIFPVGYLINDQMIYFHIADLIQRYHVKTIVLWRPSKQKDIQEKITKFMTSLNYMFYGAKELTNINGLSTWYNDASTSKLTTISYTFYDTGIADINALANWKTPNLTTMNYTFSNNTHLTDIGGLRLQTQFLWLDCYGCRKQCSHVRLHSGQECVPGRGHG